MDWFVNVLKVGFMNLMDCELVCVFVGGKMLSVWRNRLFRIGLCVKVDVEICKYDEIIF